MKYKTKKFLILLALILSATPSMISQASVTLLNDTDLKCKFPAPETQGTPEGHSSTGIKIDFSALVFQTGIRHNISQNTIEVSTALRLKASDSRTSIETAIFAGNLNYGGSYSLLKNPGVPASFSKGLQPSLYSEAFSTRPCSAALRLEYKIPETQIQLGTEGAVFAGCNAFSSIYINVKTNGNNQFYCSLTQGIYDAIPGTSDSWNQKEIWFTPQKIHSLVLESQLKWNSLCFYTAGFLTQNPTGNPILAATGTVSWSIKKFCIEAGVFAASGHSLTPENNKNNTVFEAKTNISWDFSTTRTKMNAEAQAEYKTESFSVNQGNAKFTLKNKLEHNQLKIQSEAVLKGKLPDSQKSSMQKTARLDIIYPLNSTESNTSIKIDSKSSSTTLTLLQSFSMNTTVLKEISQSVEIKMNQGKSPGIKGVLKGTVEFKAGWLKIRGKLEFSASF